MILKTWSVAPARLHVALTPLLFPPDCFNNGGAFKPKHSIDFNRYAQDDDTDVTTIGLCQTAGDSCADKSLAYVIRHAGWNTATNENDVALIILPEAKKITSIPPVALNRDPNVPANGKELEVFGWGLISNDPKVILPTHIMTGKQKYLTNTACQVGWQGSAVITNDMLCGKSETVSAARGDSGTCMS
jgi:hypothetical protein